MHLLGRFSDLISSNVHALFDRAENPERMLAHRLRTLEAGLTAAQSQAAKAVAAERRLRRALAENRAAANHWKEQARFALTQNREDLARRALAYKIEHDSVVIALEPQHRDAHQLSAQVKASLRTFKDHLAQARHRHSLLLARHRAAEVRLQVERSLEENFAYLGTSLNQWQRRLADQEDDLLAQLEINQLDNALEADIGYLKQKQKIEEELKSIKGEAVNRNAT